MLAVSAHAADDEGPDFVIKGATLDVRWARATIQAPSIYWKWKRADRIDAAKEDIYQCVNRANEKDNLFLLFISREPVKPLDSGEMDDLVKDIRRNTPQDRFVIARPQHEPSDIPWPGSYKLRYELASVHGTAYLYGYAARKTRAFVTLCVTLAPEEPPDFTLFSRSLVVREEESGRTRRTLTGLVLLVAAIGVVQWLRSR